MGAHGRVTFQAILARLAAAAPARQRPPGECQTQRGVCQLCWAHRLGYPQELALKQQALREYWRFSDLEPLRPAPQGRYYRAVSKRRAFGNVLGLVDADDRRLLVDRCAIEPPEHREIFRALQRAAGFTSLAPYLNFAVAKSASGETWLLLNLRTMVGPVVAMARKVCRPVTGVAGIYCVQGRAGDPYYSGSGRPVKIFGRSQLRLQVGQKTFAFPIDAFSQVNPSLLQGLLDATREGLLEGLPLVDLYCGYGLIGLGLGSSHLLGLEQSQAAVRAARANARHLGVKARFLAVDLQADSLLHHLKAGDFQAVLDPPRGGPASGVIEALASRRPQRVVHLFCDIERVSVDLARWRSCGYEAWRAVPLDMFAGTSQLEIVVSLAPKEALLRPTNPQPRRKAGGV